MRYGKLIDQILMSIAVGRLRFPSGNGICWPLEVTVPPEKYQIENAREKLPLEGT